MSIIRIHKHETNFLIIDKHVLEDKGMSWSATGLHAYLMGLPNNWQINIEDLCNRKRGERGGDRCSRDYIYKLLSELIDHGYVRRGEQQHKENGHLGGYEYNVYEKPTVSANAVQGTTVSGLTCTNKDTEDNKDTNNTPASPKPDAVGFKECSRHISLWADFTKGRPVIGRAIRALKPLIRDFGAELVYNRLLAYTKANKPVYASLERFAETFGQWETDEEKSIKHRRTDINPYDAVI